ncbi:CoA-binding protein [Desulfothermobacter acidiphilus]|uniref:CoA-binding protein n=1 Tax=Desulfothermobacter acidiphilus TaxID=1938353 RepID=UPI003F8963A7
MQGDIEEFLQQKRWAVVGVSRNPEKYGHRVYLQLKQLGYDVYAVNPNCSEIEGEPCFPSLSALPVVPQVINVVVPPEIAVQTVKEAIALGIKRIWLQPGSESDEALTLADKAGALTIDGQCVLSLSRPQEG